MAQYNLELDQIDVKTAFLYGDLNEEIFMIEPLRFKTAGKDKFGLQTEEVTIWAEAIAEAMIQAIWQRYAWQEVTKSKYNPYVYCNKLLGREYIYLLLYVDDILIASRSRSAINSLKKQLSSEFEMKDLSEVKKVLSMKIERDRNSGNVRLMQKGYL